MDLTALLSELIAPVATLSGVALTLLYTGRREDRRARVRSNEERVARLFDSRRVAFMRYLTNARKHEKLVRQSLGPDAGDFFAFEEQETAWTRIEDEWTEIHLLAPELDKALSEHRAIREKWLGTVVCANSLVADADRIDIGEMDKMILADQFSGVVDTIEWNMRVSLGSLGNVEDYFKARGITIEQASRAAVLRRTGRP